MLRSLSKSIHLGLVNSYLHKYIIVFIQQLHLFLTYQYYFNFSLSYTFSYVYSCNHCIVNSSSLLPILCHSIES